MSELKLTKYLEKEGGRFRGPNGEPVTQGLVAVGVRITHRPEAVIAAQTQVAPEQETVSAPEPINPDAVISATVGYLRLSTPLRERYAVASGQQRRPVIRDAHYWNPDTD